MAALMPSASVDLDTIILIKYFFWPSYAHSKFGVVRTAPSPVPLATQAVSGSPLVYTTAATQAQQAVSQFQTTFCTPASYVPAAATPANYTGELNLQTYLNCRRCVHFLRILRSHSTCSTRMHTPYEHLASIKLT